jgi:alpha-galactosidase
VTHLLKLDGATTTIVFDRSAGGVPRCLYWGRRLARAEGMAIADRRPVPPASLDEPVVPTLFPEPGVGFFGLPALRGSRERRAWATAFRLDRTEPCEGGVVFHLLDAHAELALDLTFLLDAETDVLTASSALTNSGATPFDLERCAAASFSLGAFVREALVLDGAWSREFQPRRVTLSRDALVRANLRGRTSHDRFPGLVAGEAGFDDERGLVFGFHLGWSGNSRVSAEILADGTRQVTLGEQFEAGEVRLGPGEMYRSPEVHAVAAPDGLNGLRDRFHRFVRLRVLRAAKPRPVHFNSWEAVYFDHDRQGLLDLIERAARVGVERFVLDDGWFSGRHNDRAGLGDWTPDAGKYPGGLAPLIQAVTSRGMEFGLWIEPEMVNPDSALYRAHPDWVLHLDPLPRKTARHQLALDLTRREVSDRLFDVLSRLLSENEIAYLKWDMNRDLTAAGSGGIAAGHRYTRALYALIDRVRSAHPRVEIESCASGGGRADYGILRRTDRIWTSDSNDALERQRIQRGFGLFFPPEVMGSHIGPATCHVTGRSHQASFRAVAALFGHLGLELDLRKASAEEAQQIAQVVALYKRFRDLLHGGRSYVLPVADGARWAHGVVSSDRGEGLFAVVQSDVPALDGGPSVKLRGLDAGAVYRVRLLDPAGGALAVQAPDLERWQGDGVSLGGELLMEAGLSVTLARPETAVLVRVEREAAAPDGGL